MAQTTSWQLYLQPRVTRGRSHPILSPSLRVVERAEVLPEFLKTSNDDNFTTLRLFEDNYHEVAVV